jgi:hypothetical protein
MEDYYSRENQPHRVFGYTFKTKEDEKNEKWIASLLESKWNCECKSFGHFSPIDWWFEFNGVMIGIGELKARPHKWDKFKTVYLNVRKWLSMQLATIGLGVPAIFVVKFTDNVMWINIKDVDASRHIIGGCTKIVKSRNDIEPIIEVPINSMSDLG